MKTLKLLAIGIFLLFNSNIQAQVSVNVNIGTPPVWGPVGYSNVDFYYIPDIEVYYDIHMEQFIYFNNGRWIHTRYLPKHCRNYDLYHGYKVVLQDYHGQKPYIYFKDHKAKYYKGYKGKPQKLIGQKENFHYNNNNYKQNNKHNQGNQKHEKGNKKH